jgi:MYXO-CTERM domain-containing protein
MREGHREGTDLGYAGSWLNLLPGAGFLAAGLVFHIPPAKAGPGTALVLIGVVMLVLAVRRRRRTIRDRAGR